MGFDECIMCLPLFCIEQFTHPQNSLKLLHYRQSLYHSHSRPFPSQILLFPKSHVNEIV